MGNRRIRALNVVEVLDVRILRLIFLARFCIYHLFYLKLVYSLSYSFMLSHYGFRGLCDHFNINSYT